MIGVDTVRVSRVKNAIESEAFAARVFTESEREYCDKAACPEQSYAGIFCAKEATVKALRCGFGRGVMPTDIEICHETSGAPTVRLYGQAEKLRGERKASVSISHDGDYAVAVALII